VEHRLVQGGESFLPFARSCVAKLKRLGLPYADQSYEVDGVSIKVRIQPGHEYIRLEGGSTGQYLVIPANDTYPTGDGDADTPKTSVITVKGTGQLSVQEHVDKKAGPIDWKNWKKGAKYRSLSYDHGMQHRYRMNPLIDAIGSGITFSYEGVEYATGRTILGMGVFNTKVDDIYVERIILIARIDNQVVAAFSAVPPANAAPSELPQELLWEEIGRISLPGETIIQPDYTVTSGLVQSTVGGSTYPAYFRDAFAISPDGQNFVGLLSADPPTGTLVKKIVRGTITVSGAPGSYVLSATFTVGELVGSDANHTAVIGSEGVASPFTRTCGNRVYTVHTAFSGIPVGAQATVPFLRGGTAYSNYVGTGLLASQKPILYTVTQNEAVGVDYTAAGSEIIVYRAVSSVGTESKFQSTGEDWQGGGSGEYMDPAYLATESSTSQQIRLAGSGFVTSVNDFVPRSMDFTYTDVASVTEGVTFNAGSEKILSAEFSRGHEYIGGQTLSSGYYVTEAVTDPVTEGAVCVYALDARDRSAIYEVTTQTATVDSGWVWTPAYPNQPTFTNNVKVEVKINYGGSEAFTHTLYDLATGSTRYNLGWVYSSRISTEPAFPPYGDIASAAQGQFVASLDLRKTAFSTTASMYIPFTEVLFTVGLVKTGAAFAPLVEMQKIPFYGTAHYRMNPVRVL